MPCAGYMSLSLNIGTIHIVSILSPVRNTSHASIKMLSNGYRVQTTWRERILHTHSRTHALIIYTSLQNGISNSFLLRFNCQRSGRACLFDALKHKFRHQQKYHVRNGWVAASCAEARVDFFLSNPLFKFHRQAERTATTTSHTKHLADAVASTIFVYYCLNAL